MSPEQRSILENFEKTCPSIISRKMLAEMLGGMVSPRTLANLDSLGKGPGLKVMVGRKVGYPKDVALLWIKQNIKFN